MSIRILITGGTIDCLYYDPDEDEWDYDGTFIPEMLRQSQVSEPVEVEKLMLKDSREITNEDRELILERCKNCEEDNIIITHGTFTMPDTAGYLGGKIDKTIVLTGSFIPYNEDNSDALFNLGCAFGAVQSLVEGVYLTMNGKVFPYDNVKKNLDTGKFEELDD